MFQLLSFLALEKSDIAIGIVSGHQVIKSRLKPQIETWVPTFPSVYAFSDFFSEKDMASINLKHTNITFVEIKNKSDHLIGTKWTNPWYSAQPRYLPCMYELWKREPNAKWYLFGDDDTYFYIENIMRRLSRFNSDEPVSVSYFWCAWNNIGKYMKPQRDCHLFAQTGAGALYSQKLMSMIGPHILECNDMFNDAEHAASARISVCMEIIFGYEKWAKNAYAQPWRSGLHPGVPDSVVAEGNTWDAPGSFHKIKGTMMNQLELSHLLKEKDGFYDFATFSFRTLPVELTRRRIWQFTFGYSFSNIGSHSLIKRAISNIKKINEKPFSFEQEYEDNITVKMICNNKLQKEEIFVENVIRNIHTQVIVKLHCPKKQSYFV